MGRISGGERTKKRPTKLTRELARAPVWNLGQWGSDAEHVRAEDATRGVAKWGEAVPDCPLAKDLVAAICLPKGGRTREGLDQAALLEKLARQPLLVSPWVAVPKVRMAVAGLRVTPEGRRARHLVFPHLCTFALRRAWDEVAPEPGAYLDPDRDADHDVAAVARRLHTRAMKHMVDLLRRVSKDPEAFADIVEHEPPARRDLVLLDNLGEKWRAKTAAILGIGRGAHASLAAHAQA
jgi:hypothetical protein